jgi:hypothetical protein
MEAGADHLQPVKYQKSARPQAADQPFGTAGAGDCGGRVAVQIGGFGVPGGGIWSRSVVQLAAFVRTAHGFKTA